MTDKAEEALLLATEAKTQANAAMEFMVQGFQRVERGLEALRSENTSQHAEGRRNLTNLAKGVHRRFDEQDVAREKLRDDVNAKLADMSQGMTALKDDIKEDVDGAIKAVEATNSDGRGKLHKRIDGLMLAVLALSGTALVTAIGIIGWLLANPGVRIIFS